MRSAHPVLSKLTAWARGPAGTNSRFQSVGLTSFVITFQKRRKPMLGLLSSPERCGCGSWFRLPLSVQLVVAGW